MTKRIKDKQEAIELLKVVITSCDEGYTRKWNTSQDEALDGFLDMKDILNEVVKFLKKK